MEKAILPIKYMKQTQGVNGNFSHQETYAIDFAHKHGKTDVYAPFTGIIKRISPSSGNAVWLESKEKVLWADGTIDYMTVLTIHDNDVSNLYVGKEIKQGEIYYQMGDAGNATGVHLHLEVGRGKFIGNGWTTNSLGKGVINNAVHPANAFFITEDIEVVFDGGYNYRKLVGVPKPRDITKNQIEINAFNLRCRIEPNGEVLGYINEGIYDVIDTQYKDGYYWYKIDHDKWVAHSDEWSKLYLLESKVDLKKLQEENEKLKAKVKEYEENFIFTYNVKITDKYFIKLNEGETLYIKK